MPTVSPEMLFNDAYRFMDRALAALLQLIDILLVMKLVFISSRMTSIAAYYNIRVF